MKVFLFILTFIVPVLTISGQGVDSLGWISISPEQFREELQIVQFPLIVDVREPFEFRRSRIKGAVNIPASGSLELTADTINKDTYLFFYCTSGFRSRRVSKFFSSQGFTHIYNLEGGISAWKKAGMKVDRRKAGRRN